ncbi:MAG: hypothetical protein HYV90_04160 [Candidatus Woesebacteria bacterium]|nr:MAG: hypothetical protein HYV90_04160 [Candidatus Woesebacteria bacterium]
MRKFTTSLLLIISLPFRLLKKSKIDNFAGGLIFGAIFSLVVNIVTVQIQELITKQHILEALENEIVNNTLIANTVIEKNTKLIADKLSYNPFTSLQYYSNNLWTQSSEPLQYISQLDQDTQIAITSYYTLSIPAHNRMNDSVEKFVYPHLQYCNSIDMEKGLAEKTECDLWNNILLDTEKSTAVAVSTKGFKLLETFHPTKDRLNNWFLRLLMGDKSTRILSGQ